MTELRTRQQCEAVHAPRESKSCSYALYGLRIRSEFALPVASVCSAPFSDVDVVIRRASIASDGYPEGRMVVSVPCPVHGIDMVEYRGPGGTWIELPEIGMFHVTPDARELVASIEAEADPRSVELALSGPLLVFMRHQQGQPTLHASAMTTERGAVAFIGPRGQGKSTMLTSFLRSGGTLLTDDALPLMHEGDTVYGYPGPPYMKMWHETVQHGLGLQEKFPVVTAGVDKELVSLAGRYECSTSLACMQAIYVLQRYDPAVEQRANVTIHPLGKREALLALLTETYPRPYLLPQDDAVALPLYARLVNQVPVSILRYPHGFEWQDAVRGQIIEDLETR